MEVGVVPSNSASLPKGLGASPSSKYKVSGAAGGKFVAKSFGRKIFSSGPSTSTADPAKMSKKAFKEMKKERRAKKPNFEAIDAANSLWKISISRLDSDKRIEHVGLVLEKVTGKIAEIAVVHDASRVLQSCVKFGTSDQRQAIFDELKGNYLNLCQNHYGYHVVEKLLKYGYGGMRDIVLEELTGHFKHISQHRDGHHVLEFLYSNPDMMTTAQKKLVLVEFFGHQFKIYTNPDGSPHSLRSIFEQEPESRQELAMANVRSFLDKMVAKQLTRVGVFHTLLRHYLEVAHLSTIRDMMTICQTFLDDLWQTEDGARVLMYCLAFSVAKDRKTTIKAFSDKVKEMSVHPGGSLVLMFCLDIVDDTVLLRKQIVQDIADNIIQLWTSRHGIKLLLHLLAPHSQRYFSAGELAAIAVPVLHFEDERKDYVVSKKNATQRRTELLGDRILPTIVEACVEHEPRLNWLIRAPTECAILIEALRLAKDTDYGQQAMEKVAMLVSVAASPDGVIEEVSSVDEAPSSNSTKTEVLDEDSNESGSDDETDTKSSISTTSIIKLEQSSAAAVVVPEKETTEPLLHVMTHPVAHRVLRRCILFENPAADQARYQRHSVEEAHAAASSSAASVSNSALICKPEISSTFAIALHGYLAGSYARWAQTCGAFVIVAIMENSTTEIMKSIVHELKPLSKSMAQDKRPGASLLYRYLQANK